MGRETVYQDLRYLCNTQGIDNSVLSRLSLLGLQPCFEDTILLAPIFVSLVILGAYRIRQCVRCGVYRRKMEELVIIRIKAACCCVNVVTDNTLQHFILMLPLDADVWR